MQRIEPGRVTVTCEHYFTRKNKLAELHAKEINFLGPRVGSGWSIAERVMAYLKVMGSKTAVDIFLFLSLSTLHHNYLATLIRSLKEKHLYRCDMKT